MVKKKVLEWQNCSEEELTIHVKHWVRSRSFQNTVLFLDGEMGAGKSTFARILLNQFCPGQTTKGSPTFPLIQQYQGHDVMTGNYFQVYHLDLYRLKNEGELHDSGLESQIEEPEVLVLVEWASLFPEFHEYWTSPVQKKKSVIHVRIEAGVGERRNFHIEEG